MNLKNLTFPRLLIGALVLNLVLSISASPFYFGAKPQTPALHVGATQRAGTDPFFKPRLSKEMNAWKGTSKPSLTPPPCEGCPPEIIYICVCPLVFCELWTACYEL